MARSDWRTSARPTGRNPGLGCACRLHPYRTNADATGNHRAWLSYAYSGQAGGVTALLDERWTGRLSGWYDGGEGIVVDGVG